MMAFLKWVLYLVLSVLSLAVAGAGLMFMLSISAVLGTILVVGFSIAFVAWIIKELINYKKP